MAQRLDLDAVLKAIDDEVTVYFQEPPSREMKFPCIVYKRDFIETKFADNVPYINKKRYEVQVIHEDPDNDIVDKVKALPRCTYNRFFIADNLNHDVFTLFF